MTIVFNATRRDGQGTGASRRLRGTGKVPGILYGGGQAAQPILLDHNELYHHLKREAFHASVLTMELDGAARQVLLRDLQMHPYKPQVLHVDFQLVEANRKIHMKVPLHFINAEISRGVKIEGGIASHTMNELDITCLPADLPEYIEVDLRELSLGHSLRVSDLKMPGGVEPVLHRGENPVVASVVVHKAAPAEEAPVAEAVAAAVPAAPAPAAPPAKQPEKK